MLGNLESLLGVVEPSEVLELVVGSRDVVANGEAEVLEGPLAIVFLSVLASLKVIKTPIVIPLLLSKKVLEHWHWS